jgi:transcription-repair coupling factor (superfamily II helicase)
VPEVRLLPGREFPMTDAARTAFRARWRERIDGDPTKARVYKDIGTGLASGGIEYYLPLFFDEVGTIFDVTRERVRQIEAKAVEKLRQPGSDVDLASFVDDSIVERWRGIAGPARATRTPAGELVPVGAGS